MKKAFTLIELLIVVAIIAILAAIAVPNFLEAQTRSKVSRVLADCRSVATAMEAYRVDTNKYPYPRYTNIFWSLGAAVELTTPIAYMTSVDLKDPFKPDANTPNIFQFEQGDTLNFINYQGVWGLSIIAPGNSASGWGDVFPTPADLPTGYLIYSMGPDKRYSASPSGVTGIPDQRQANQQTAEDCYNSIYDPTNGTISDGDIGYASVQGVPSIVSGVFGAY